MRRVAVVFLVVLGCGLTAAALISLWTRATILDTDRYVETMAPIAASPAVQKAVVDKLRTALRVTVIAAVVLAALSLLAGKSPPRSPWLAGHRAASSWGIVLLGGLVLVAWDNPTAGVVLVDAALIAVALWIVTVLVRGARQPAS